MLASASPSVPEAVIRDLGYQSIDDFLRVQVRHALEQKISYYQSRIDFYEQKYGMSFEQFRHRVTDANDSVLTNYGSIEKEDDDINWDDALDFVGIYAADLRQIRP